MEVTRRDVLRAAGLWSGALAGATRPAGSREAPSPERESGWISLRDLESLACRTMSPEAREFIQSGAADEITARRNVEAFQALPLRPRALVDVSRIDTRVSLFGRELAHPILVSPTASHGLVHAEAEVATALGARAAESTLIVSTFSTKPLEEIRAASPGPLWHATYLMKDRGITREFFQRAKAAGFEAIVLPIDSPVVGARDREHRTYRFRDRKPLSLWEYPVDYRRYPATWKDVEWAREATDLPMVLKGILDPEDANRAVQAGASAVFVSNHGGRNLDTLPATIEVLPEIADRVAGRVPLLVDGGVRRGTDVLKALALGARAVLIGRPALYGLAVGGARGVSAVINTLRNELEMAMALAGRPAISKLDRTVLYTPRPPK